MDNRMSPRTTYSLVYWQVGCKTNFSVSHRYLITVVLTLVEESHSVLPLYFLHLFLLLRHFQTLTSEVSERIPFILLHNIRFGFNEIQHPQKLVNLYPTEKANDCIQIEVFDRCLLCVILCWILCHLLLYEMYRRIFIHQ